MTSSACRYRLRSLAAVLVVGGLLVSGCGKKPQPDVSSASEENVAKAETASAEKTVVATPVARGAVQRDRLHQAFDDAVRSADDPPPGDAIRPPDETVSKKPVHRILDAVKNDWDTIRFTSPQGKKIDWTAKVETNQGTFEIALFPEQAPNHVRNFIALARAGYYDQLFFERIRHEENTMTGQEFHCVEAGCPLGTGTIGTGSIGYWLKGEFTPADKMSHGEGTLGACRGEEADSAATRFYISLNKAEFLDGNYTIFGKVIAGLDVLRKIGQTPVVSDDEGNSHPETPIVIEKVTVKAREAAIK
jgi:cyclophilin family peptidyl-prolyl cis-trans isomerase